MTAMRILGAGALVLALCGALPTVGAADGTGADARFSAADSPGSSTLEAPSGLGAVSSAVHRVIDTESGKTVVLATALGPDAILVTKASQLEDHPHLAVLNALAQRTAIRRVLIDRRNDLAVLEPESPPTASIRLPAPDEVSREQELGTIVQCVVGADQPPRVGIIAARSRAIEQRNGVLGVRLSMLVPPGGGVAIEGIMENGAAEKAGLASGDRILAVDGTEVKNSRDLRGIVFEHLPGDELMLRVGRGDETIEVPLRLGYQTDTFDKLDRNMIISGETSRRKTGFEHVLQHDIDLTPTETGSPLFDIDGRLIGLNIARFDRVTVYALPIDVVLGSIDRIRREAGPEVAPAEVPASPGE